MLDWTNVFIIKDRRRVDIIKGYTTKGIHRDDFNIYINGNLVNIYGSQGQHITAVLSLKMCELEIIKEETGEYPILLLDDFMSELDKNRKNNPKDKKTDWFYKNEEFDRKLDDRADKNNYRTM